MSMITEQVVRMRRLADEMEKSTFVHEATHFIAIKVLREAANTIEQLAAKVRAANMERSTAYYNGGWIPIKERLPELKQHVLLSCYGRVIYGRMISADGNSGYPIFEICDSVGEKRPIVLETTVHSEFTTSRIKAWLPLPKPYREDGDTE